MDCTQSNAIGFFFQNNMAVTLFHVRVANRQDFRSWLTAARSHLRCSLSISTVTLRSADISLGKRLNSKAWFRLCLASLPFLAPPAQGETCEPGGESAARYMFVFRRELGVEVEIDCRINFTRCCQFENYESGTRLAALQALTPASENWTYFRWVRCKTRMRIERPHNKVLFKLCNWSNSLLLTTKESESRGSFEKWDILARCFQVCSMFSLCVQSLSDATFKLWFNTIVIKNVLRCQISCQTKQTYQSWDFRADLLRQRSRENI